ncbi:MAG: sulfite exporter TauE/SafE family protein [Acidobacteriota bacterium]|nr:MAG: sulfite exporter TauE/SafE family protein [Acidobacteriota bacterium]
MFSLVIAANFLNRLEDWVGAVSSRLAEAVSGASDPLALGIFFAAGVLASLTPCVYPMIPIVVAYMGGAETAAMSSGASRQTRKMRVVVRSLAYVGGMALVYTALGLVALLARRPFGSMTQTFWGYAIVAAVLAIFGLSLLGLFEVRVPTFILDRIGTGPRKGMLGAVAMGASSAIVAAPCAAPIVVPLAAIVAQQGRVLFGTIAMLAFSLGLGLLLMLIGVSSGLAASMPRPGGWMVTLKRIMGVVMLLLAAWFLYQGWWRL